MALALSLGACSSGDPPPTPPPTTDFGAIDAMFGGDGLIRGFDPAKVIWESPATLKQAVPKSFEIDSICDDIVCSAQAPPVPGENFPINIYAWGRGFVEVKFDLHGPGLLHLYSRLETALGDSEIIDSNTRVYKYDSLRYLMSANPPSWRVTVEIRRDDSNDVAALDPMFGGDGLIRGFDPAQVVGKSPASLIKALPASFVLDSCDESACAAQAPLPGGTKVRIGVVRAWGSNVAVSFELPGPQLLHLYSRLETALGGSEIVGQKRAWKETRVYTHDSLRYVMRADGMSIRNVTVKITTIDDAEKLFD